MIQTEKIQSLAKQAIYLVSAHTTMFILYYYAHGKVDMLYFLMDDMPIMLLFCIVPLAAVLFLTTQSARQGAVVLLGILPAELIYNIVKRFTGSALFSVQGPAFLWKILYEGSFGIVLVLEVIAFWLTFKLLREIHRHLR